MQYFATICGIIIFIICIASYNIRSLYSLYMHSLIYICFNSFFLLAFFLLLLFFVLFALGVAVIDPTLKSCTPMTANTNCRRLVTRTMFPIVFTATMTHCTTCWFQHLTIKQTFFQGTICLFVFHSFSLYSLPD